MPSKRARVGALAPVAVAVADLDALAAGAVEEDVALLGASSSRQGVSTSMP